MYTEDVQVFNLCLLPLDWFLVHKYNKLWEYIMYTRNVHDHGSYTYMQEKAKSWTVLYDKEKAKWVLWPEPGTI